MTNISLTQNIELSNYSFKYTPTKSSEGGTFIANR